MSHQLRRHPNNTFSCREQIPLKSAREMTAVLNRPTTFRTEPGSPPQQTKMIFAGGADSDLTERYAAVVDRDDGVGPLVSINPECDHGTVSFPHLDGHESTGRHIPVRAMTRSS
jgi:hypothetical protein